MSKLKHFGGFAGRGRHRLQVQHGPWEQMRILFTRHSDGLPQVDMESRSPELDGIR